MDKYNLKKNRNQELISLIVKHVSFKTEQRIKECNNFMQFVSDKTLNKKKQIAGDSCKNRFCPICSWRLAKKHALQISVLMKYLEDEHKKDFIFLTLTAPNVSGEDLINEITRYNKSYERLVKRKDVKNINKGYIRKLEITYNKQTNKYHPHFHIVMAVNKSYFTDKAYIKQSKWLEMWREAMDSQEITQVDVRRLKKSETNKEIQEIAKYSAKDTDMLLNQEVFDTFYKALRGRQVITYNGLFKDANKLYKDKKLEKYKEIDTTEYVYFMLYRWGKGEYVETEKRELTEDECNRVNKQLINEIEVD